MSPIKGAVTQAIFMMLGKTMQDGMGLESQYNDTGTFMLPQAPGFKFHVMGLPIDNLENTISRYYSISLTAPGETYPVDVCDVYEDSGDVIVRFGNSIEAILTSSRVQVHMTSDMILAMVADILDKIPTLQKFFNGGDYGNKQVS